MSDFNSSKRIGIMGGTFDPIHYGHLMLAEQIRTSFFLDEILFIPVGIPAHKSDKQGASSLERLEMTQLATLSNRYFSVSDIEVKRNKTTYTVDTIRELKHTLYAHDTLFFITGADAIMFLDQWKDYHELVDYVTFVGATRPGIDETSLNQKLQELKSKSKLQVELCYIPALAISSTDIRDRVSRESSIKYLLPESVERYIDAKGLYKVHHHQYEQLKKNLEMKLSPYRFKHSLETSKLARKLALIHGADPVQAEIAGLCHDYAKELPQNLSKSYIEQFDIYCDPCIQSNPNLAHGEIAAELLKDEFGLDNPQILEAIKWHTYGHENMSLLCKIVFLSDAIEPSRKFEGVELLRHLAFEDVDKAIMAYLDLNSKYLKTSNKKEHLYTQQMKKTLMK